MQTYQIRHHNGRRDGDWRDVQTPQDFEKAHRKYLRMKARIRQGGIEFWQRGVLTGQKWAIPEMAK